MSSSETTLHPSERQNILVLVVEDNAINQKVAHSIISKLGFRVAQAWNGKEALEYLDTAHERPNETAKPKIILMDVSMPIMDGLQCAKMLRNEIPYRTYAQAIPIIALTATQYDNEKFLQEGMDDYLTKPIRFEALERLLTQWGLDRTNKVGL